MKFFLKRSTDSTEDDRNNNDNDKDNNSYARTAVS